MFFRMVASIYTSSIYFPCMKTNFLMSSFFNLGNAVPRFSFSVLLCSVNFSQLMIRWYIRLQILDLYSVHMHVSLQKCKGKQLDVNVPGHKNYLKNIGVVL